MACEQCYCGGLWRCCSGGARAGGCSGVAQNEQCAGSVSEPSGNGDGVG